MIDSPSMKILSGSTSNNYNTCGATEPVLHNRSQDGEESNEDRACLAQSDPPSDQPEEDHGHTPKGTVFGTYINILKNIVGAGMLSIPYVFSLAGWGMAMGLMFAMQFAAITNLYFIMKTCDMIRGMGYDASSYKGMAIAAWGSKAGKATDAVIGLYTGSTLITYGILVVEFFQTPLRGPDQIPHWVGSKPIILLACSVILIMLCSMKKIEGLKFTSVFGNASLLYAAILVFYKFTTSDNAGSVEAFEQGAGVLQALSMLVFSYNFHYNMPTYYNDLQDRSVKKMIMIVIAVYVTVSTMYIVIGMSGYLLYGDKVKSNIIKSMADGTEVTIARIVLGVMIVFTYPVVQFATRGAVARNFDVAETSIFLAFIIVAVTLLLSAVIPNIGIVLGYNGAIFGVAQHYFIPSLSFYKISGMPENQGIVPQKYRTGALVVCGAGIVVGILGLVGTTINITSGNSR
eukprot:TRINITY_DN11259_c1_g1_i1.p1 TRINITY_DN11259_c1_g1~~TRINITY_DN11259_c1_g1_i1.p1  ORF type:complete len:459 (+),score=62.24 TRINITY_DN11259_c1_g1_i1:67-1443(+)